LLACALGFVVDALTGTEEELDFGGATLVLGAHFGVVGNEPTSLFITFESLTDGAAESSGRFLELFPFKSANLESGSNRVLYTPID
jgi:hypothetical protein